MDNVKLILVIIVLLMECVACSKKSEPAVEAECTTYVSPYQVEFPDNSYRKSIVEKCDNGLYRATDLGQGKAVVEGASLVIQLWDFKTDMPYYTTFTGQ